MNEKLKKLLININSKSKPVNSFLIKQCKEIENIILSYCDLSIDLTENLYLINNNLKKIPKCFICDNNLKFIKYNKGYHKTCGNIVCINESGKINREKTMLKKYGSKNPSNVKKFQDKRNKTFIDKFGCENPFQNQNVKEKIKQTNLKRHGVENPNQNKEIQEKIKQTNLKRYGVTNPTLNAAIFERAVKNSYYYKKYILPSGKEVNIQGYEHLTLDELFKQGYKEDDIILGSIEINSHIGKILYKLDEKQHRYYPDIYIVSENKVIEVKSEYTFNNQKKKNLLKRQAILDNNINFEFKIYNNKEVLIENFKI